MTLSKSDYMLYLRHPAWLWLKKNQRHRLPAIDGNTQAIFDMGHEFEEYAEQLFSDGLKLGFNNFSEYNDLTNKTQNALTNGASTLFQGRFEADGLTCIVDVLRKTSDSDYELIEIKASTKVKPSYLYDLAFQLLVLQKTGLNVSKISVVYVSKEYERQGEIDPQQMTLQEEVTDEVLKLLETTKKHVKKAREIATATTAPDFSPRHANHLDISRTRWFEEWLDVYKHLHPQLEKDSIYYLSYPNAEQIGQLEDAGITRIAYVPEDLALRKKQVGQIQTTRDNKRLVDSHQIAQFLDTLEYPLYFFDYETFSSVIPAFDGCKPYKDYPFQYSLHILESPEAELIHKEYIHDSNTNPVPDLVAQLKEDIGETGPILTWNMSYEKGCNKRMAEIYPESEEFLMKVNERINDLMIPFSKMWFVDKNFFGSASIKYVLPALVHELTYDDLAVSDGLYARRLWTDTLIKGENGTDVEQIMNNLSEYCTLDTYAMVEILRVLEREVL